MLVNLALLLFAALASHAFLRQHFSDKEVVSRSDVILEAHIREGSVEFVPKKDSPAALWEHHLVLIPSKVFKGTEFTNPIPVVISMGLLPVVGGYSSNYLGSVFDFRTTGYPKDIVQIFDTGTSAKPPRPITGDIRTNHIWLLRRDPIQTGIQSSKRTNLFEIFDPEDIRPIEQETRLTKLIKGYAH